MTRVLLAVALVLLVLRCGCASPANTGKLKGLYMGWVGHANLGDELVLDIFGHLLRDSLLQQGLFQRVSLEYQQPLKVGAHAPINYSALNFAVLGGGSLLETSYTSRTDMCHAVRAAHVPLYVSGTGTQLPYSRYDGRNFRCVEQPVWGGVRGPLTNELLASMADYFHTNDTRQLPVFGDSGILADRIFPRVSWSVVDELDRTLAESAGVSGGAADPVLCVSGAVQAGAEGTPGFRDTAALVEAWMQKYIVVLLPVDPSTAKKQLAMYESILTNASATAQSKKSKKRADRLFFNAHINNYSLWLALLGRCDLVLTVRLHAAVMSAAAGTPFIMPYHDTISRKAKDFVLGTHGSAGWEAFFINQTQFDGSDATMEQLLQDVRERAPRQKAAFDRAAQAAYPLYIDSLKVFSHVIIPDTFRFFTDVAIRITRYYNSAIIDLLFK